MDEITTAHCKNCSTEIEGDYCHFCGQRYHDHKESFGELVYEFASDFLHFDSRFFKTVLPLLFLPGKLTKSYNEGRQRSQFHPIRLYLFSSFVYFFLFFSFTNLHDKSDIEGLKSKNGMQPDTVQLADKKSEKVVSAANADSVANNSKSGGAVISALHIDTAQYISSKDSSHRLGLDFHSSDAVVDSMLKYRISPEQYKANQEKLSKDKRDGFLRRIITIRILKINLEGAENQQEFFNKLSEVFLHNIPKMLFFLLPVFALLLKLLYIRHKQFYYVDHAILSLHYFSLIFLLLIVSQYILDAIFGISTFTALATIWIFLYLLLAMKKLYGQSWRKTIVKYFLLGFLFLFTVMFTLLINLAFTAFMV
jgi:Protein of unknown function (DUF3667)